MHFWRASKDMHAPTVDSRHFNGLLAGGEKPPIEELAVGIVTVMKANTLMALKAGRVEGEMMGMGYDKEWASFVTTELGRMDVNWEDIRKCASL